MPAHNDRTPPPNESTDQSATDALDELLAALRSDQGGARTTALRRALADETGPPANRLADVEATLDSLAADVEALEEALEGLEANDRALAVETDELGSDVERVADRVERVEEKTDVLRDELVATRDAVEGATAVRPEGDGEPPADPGEYGDDVLRRMKHVERKLDRRTSSLASELSAVEDLEARIDDLETELDQRTDALVAGLEDVDGTMEKAVRYVHEDLTDEIERLEADLGSSVDALRDDVDTLEMHAVDFTMWRRSVEETLEEPDEG